MIIVALIFSISALVLTIPFATGKKGYFVATCIILALGVAYTFLVFSSFAILSTLLLCSYAQICTFHQFKRLAYTVGAILVTVGSYMIDFGITVLTDFDDQREMARLREKYPLESLSDQLAYEERHKLARSTDDRPALQPEQQARLTDLEKKWKESDNMLRNAMMQELYEMHLTTQERFIDSPGFGARRRITPTESWLQIREELLPPVTNEPIADYDSASRSTQSESANNGTPTTPAADSLSSMHERSLVDFAHAQGFGWIKDRKIAAGFRPHRFKYRPAVSPKDTDWSVARVELVSLLKFENPRVYESKHLPRMEELRDAKTRTLDEFEASSLASLRRGEDLVVSRPGSRTLQILGSIRAGKQCLKCHDVERGDLLGAFSYVLKRND